MTIAEKIVKLNEDAEKLIDLNNQLEQALYGTDVGGKSYYDEFWDGIQRNGTMTNYSAMFGTAWTPATFKPKYDVKVSTGFYMFAFNTIGGDLVDYFDKLGRKLDFSECGNANGMFQGSQFTRVGAVYCPDNWYNAFNGCAKLVTIDEWGNYDENGKIEGGLTSCFAGCSALENITVKGIISGSISFNSSTKLTRASIESIVNHLTNATIYGTLTLSKTAVDNAFTADEWSALEATKPNWTITLV